MSRVRRSRGFTLLEVVLALCILGTAAMILIETHYNSVHLHTQMKEEVLMRSLVQQAAGIAEIEAAAGNLSGSGEFGKRYPDCQYAFQAYPVGEEYYGLHEVQVNVEGPKEDRSLLFYVYVGGDETVAAAAAASTETDATEGDSEK